MTVRARALCWHVHVCWPKLDSASPLFREHVWPCARTCGGARDVSLSRVRACDRACPRRAPVAGLETRQERKRNARIPPQSEHHAAQRGASSGAHERHTPGQRAPQSDETSRSLACARVTVHARDARLWRVSRLAKRERETREFHPRASTTRHNAAQALVRMSATRRDSERRKATAPWLCFWSLLDASSTLTSAAPVSQKFAHMRPTKR